MSFFGLTLVKALSVTFISMEAFVGGQTVRKISKLMHGLCFTDDSTSPAQYVVIPVLPANS